MKIRVGLRLKLSLLLAAIGLLGATVVAVMGYSTARSGLSGAVEQRLNLETRSLQDAINEAVGDAISGLQSIAGRSDSQTVFLAMSDGLASETDIAEAKAAFGSLPSPQQRAEISGKGIRSVYAWKHSEVHRSFQKIWLDRGYDEIYAINAAGRIVYSVSKGRDFLATVDDPEIRDSGLAEVYRMARAMKDGDVAVVPIAPYAATGTRALFIAAPTFQVDGGAFLGALVLRLDSTFLDRLIEEGLESRDPDARQGGKVSYVLDSEGTRMSDVGLDRDKALVGPSSGDLMAAVVQGRDFSGRLQAENGDRAVVQSRPLSVPGLTMSVVTEYPEAEIDAPILAMRNAMALGTAATAALLLPFGLLIGRTITRPLSDLLGAMHKIAAGRTDMEIAGLDRTDEIGEIGRAVSAIRDNALKDVETRQRSLIAEEAERGAARTALVDAMAVELQRQVGAVVQMVSSSAHELSTVAEEMVRKTGESRQKFTRAAEASRKAGGAITVIATASDNLSVATRDISGLIEESTSIASAASRQSSETGSTVKSLNQAAERIGEVLGLISAIAEQTNLLALNATIEAARAGEAGRGFAVVAAEVKALASQTAKATDDIGQQVEEIRNASRQAAVSIGEIASTVDRISHSVGAVAGAVGRQTLATKDILVNTEKAADGATTASSELDGALEAARITAEVVDDVARSATDLSAQSSVLDQAVQSFVDRIRCA